MRLFNHIKKSIYAVAVGVLGVVALAGADVSAATIINQPQINSKYVRAVGDTVSVDSYGDYVANFKINGKSASKMKKSVKTVQTDNNVSRWENRGNYTRYSNEEFNPDSVDTSFAQSYNTKYISGGKYELTFLKAGTYKVSYDVYSYPSGNYSAEDTYGYSGEKKTVSPDGKSTTYSYDLKKTHHVDTYKVLTTTSPVKSISLGKSKITYTYKKNGTKTNYKKTYKNKYLQGKSGKLSIKTNSNYKVTSAYVITYDENGSVVVTGSGNNKTVNYGTGYNVSKYMDVKYEVDNKGDYVYLKDATGAELKDENGNRIKSQQLVTTSTSTTAFKPTKVYIGYKDSFTGDYVTYSVGTKQVYVRRVDERGQELYQKDEAGKTTSKYVVDTVTATVVTEKYPERRIVDGAYKTYEVVYETVYLPGAFNGYNPYKSNEYYLNPECKDYERKSDGNSYAYRTSGTRYLVSKDGISEYNEYTYTDSDGEVRYVRYRNTAYRMKFNYGYSNQGSWQVVDETETPNYIDYTVDDKGDKVSATRYKWVETKDQFNNTTPIVDTNYVSLGVERNRDPETFNMK